MTLVVPGLRGAGPADVRATISARLRAQLPTFPVMQWLPEDVEELPCAVVGRPAGIPSPDISTGHLTTTVVTVVGRRLTSDDAQQELDDALWLVFNAMNRFRGWVEPDGSRYRVTEYVPELVAIASDEYPVYRITVDAVMVDC